MDPLTIIGAVASISKTAYSAYTNLYTFINETKDVDQTVIELAKEVHALNRALEGVKAGLESRTVADAGKRRSDKDSKQLWHTVYGALMDCRTTVSKIDAALDGVRENRSHWVTQAVRQVKINLRKEELSCLRAQTHTHCSALNMALQMVNIQVAYLAPEVVITDLGPRIENLQGSLDLLTISLEDQRTEFACMLGKSTGGDSANTEQLQRLARHVLSEATTVHESTIAGGSVHGDPIADEVQARTLNWIPELVTKEQGSSKLSVTRSQDERTPPSEPGGIPDADLSKGRTPYDDTELASSDLDDEFEIDVTQRLIDKGKELFNSAKYAEALGFLQKGVTTYNRLSSGCRLQLDLTEVPLIIAICKYHLKDLGQAESDLLELVRQESCSDQDAIRKCRIADILSQIYLIKNQLETAEDYCRKSLKGRRRLLGKEHADYFASLGLLSDICSRRGKKEEAVVYQDMIPPEIARLQKRIRPEEFHATNPPEANSDILPRPGPTLKRKTSGVYDCSFSPDTITPTTGSRGMPATLWTAAMGWRQINLDRNNLFQPVSISPDGTMAATFHGGKSYKLVLWDASTGVERATLWRASTDQYIACSGLSFSPDNKLLAMPPVNEGITLWDTTTLKAHSRIPLNGDSSQFFAFSLDGKLMVGGDSSLAWLWDTATEKQWAIFDGHTDMVTDAAFSRDGKFVATASLDKTAGLWETVTGKRLAVLEEHTDGLIAVNFSPNGNLIATASSDRTILIWDLANRTVRSRVTCDTYYRYGLRFLPDGELLAAVSDSDIIKFFDVGTGELRVVLRDIGLCSGIEFSPDGKFMAVPSSNGKIMLWYDKRDPDLAQNHSSKTSEIICL